MQATVVAINDFFNSLLAQVWKIMEVDRMMNRMVIGLGEILHFIHFFFFSVEKPSNGLLKHSSKTVYYSVTQQKYIYIYIFFLFRINIEF